MAKKISDSCNKPFQKIRSEWCELDFASKVVLLIGLVLLSELIFTIFFYPNQMEASTDVVFRTALSSVIGYVLGGMNQHSADEARNDQQAAFISREKDSPSHLSPARSKRIPHLQLQNARNIRVLFIAVICLACIITLATATIFNQLEYTDGLIQVRNLISTTIGFLISKANHHP